MQVSIAPSGIERITTQTQLRRIAQYQSHLRVLKGGSTGTGDLDTAHVSIAPSGIESRSRQSMLYLRDEVSIAPSGIEILKIHPEMPSTNKSINHTFGY